jgi:GH24 family phage-related lysozyme (muramidase)
MAVNNRARVIVAMLTISAAGFGTWQASEGFTDHAIIPTRGDVPTLGHGSTRYEDGSRVKLGDRITRPRAEELARNLMKADERRLSDSLPGVRLHQAEYNEYLDFIGQYGIGNWRGSSMRRELLAGNYAAACQSLLRFKFSAGFDCSTPGNRVCRGVWDRQVERNAKCMAAQ